MLAVITTLAFPGLLLLVVYVLPIHFGSTSLDRPKGFDSLYLGLPGARCSARLDSA